MAAPAFAFFCDLASAPLPGDSCRQMRQRCRRAGEAASYGLTSSATGLRLSTTLLDQLQFRRGRAYLRRLSQYCGSGAASFIRGRPGFNSAPSYLCCRRVLFGPSSHSLVTFKLGWKRAKPRARTSVLPWKRTYTTCRTAQRLRRSSRFHRRRPLVSQCDRLLAHEAPGANPDAAIGGMSISAPARSGAPETDLLGP